MLVESFFFEIAVLDIAKNLYAGMSNIQLLVKNLLHENVAQNSAKTLLFKIDHIEMLAKIPLKVRCGKRSV